MGEMEPGMDHEQRVSVSLSTLRAELTGLELRLVDRLNKQLENKADRAPMELLQKEVSHSATRLLQVEQTMVRREGPFEQRIRDLENVVDALSVVAGYRKWLWAQTIALLAIAVPVVFFILDHLLAQGGIR